MPVGQAREAVTIWLAIIASHPPASSLQAGLPVGGGPGAYTLAGRSLVATWTYPGEYAEYLASPGAQPTADGYLLAHAMTALPVQRFQQVLDRGWTRWLDPHTDEAALAATLGINAPTVPVPPLSAANPPPGSGQPVCTP